MNKFKIRFNLKDLDPSSTRNMTVIAHIEAEDDEKAREKAENLAKERTTNSNKKWKYTVKAIEQM